MHEYIIISYSVVVNIQFSTNDSFYIMFDLNVLRFSFFFKFSCCVFYKLATQQISCFIFFSIQVLKALHYLKSDLNVIHRDVKPSNVLVNKQGQVKICDFGISGHLVDSKARTQVGCEMYMAVSLARNLALFL